MAEQEPGGCRRKCDCVWSRILSPVNANGDLASCGVHCTGINGEPFPVRLQVILSFCSHCAKHHHSLCTRAAPIIVVVSSNYKRLDIGTHIQTFGFRAHLFSTHIFSCRTSGDTQIMTWHRTVCVCVCVLFKESFVTEL